jgi:hypothetical protein
MPSNLWKTYTTHMFLFGLKLAHQRLPLAFGGFSCSFVEAKFNANSLLLNICHFDISRHTWKWCKENSQNSETRALIKMPVSWLTVERHSKRHLAAQVCSANGLRSIFKFSEILGNTSYGMYVWLDRTLLRLNMWKVTVLCLQEWEFKYDSSARKHLIHHHTLRLSFWIR